MLSLKKGGRLKDLNRGNIIDEQQADQLEASQPISGDAYTLEITECGWRHEN